MEQRNLVILLADSAHAKIYLYDEDNEKLKLLNEMFFPRASLKAGEIMSDESGRYQKSGSLNEGTYEPLTDPKEVEAMKFATKVSESLDKIDHETHNFVIIAPGHFQSMLKNKLKKTTLKKVDSYIDKDYIKLNTKDLEKHLEHLLNLKF